MAATLGGAAGAALAAGVDVEPPTVKAFGEPLPKALADGPVPQALVDRARHRVLVQKAQLGLLAADWDPVPPAPAGTDLDDPGHCAAASCRTGGIRLSFTLAGCRLTYRRTLTGPVRRLDRARRMRAECTVTPAGR